MNDQYIEDMLRFHEMLVKEFEQKHPGLTLMLDSCPDPDEGPWSAVFASLRVVEKPKN